MNSNKVKEIQRIKRVFILITVILTLLFGFSLTRSIYSDYEAAYKFAEIEAKSSFDKDIMYRSWAALHGGVYVPMTKETPPNPYLEFIQERDIETPSGKKLTLLNPAYMTRQVFEIAQDTTYRVKGHITSLNPMRPENKPDKWEENTLRGFNQKQEYVSGIEEMDGKKFLRYMKPLETHKSCLKCHARQGYEVGDIIGGISVSVPIEKYTLAANEQSVFVIFAHSLIYLFILFLLIYGYKKIVKISYIRIASEKLVKKSEEELKTKNKELKQKEEFLSIIYNNTDVGIFLVKVENNDFIYEGINPTHEKLLGIKKEELIGKRPKELQNMLGAETVKYIEKLYSKCVESKTASQSEYHSNEGLKIGWWYTRITPLLDDETGEVEYLIGSAMNIDDRKNTEEALMLSEEKYRKYIEFSPTPIFVTNAKAEYTYVNNAACKMLGYNFEELTQMGIKDLTPRQDGTIKLTAFNELQEKGFMQDFKTRLLKKDGTSIPIVLDSVKIADNQLVAFCKDISAVENAERLKSEIEVAEKTALIKQQLLANISHEMRTPMNGIIGMLDFLSDTNLDTQQQDFLDTIKDSSESLLHIINDVLNLSKIEQGKLELVKEKTSIPQLIINVIKVFKGQAKQKQLSIDYVLDGNFPWSVLIDKNQFKQILYNLVSNAIKYTDKGAVLIYLYLLERKGKELLGKIEVVDSGIGIATENKDEVFQPFKRIDDSYTRSTEGAGIGLSIVKKLVGLMGGEIDFESKAEVGTKFWFTFKAQEIDADPVEAIGEEKIDINKYKLRILLAEDKKVNQKVATMILKRNGCTVDIAENGAEVLEIFEEGKYDVILMDIMMPKMDGIEAMQNLREKYSKLPPIIGISAHALEGDSERFIKLGLDDYLEKPIQKKKLLNKLSKWCIKN